MSFDVISFTSSLRNQTPERKHHYVSKNEIFMTKTTSFFIGLDAWWLGEQYRKSKESNST
ncbi:MAG: hypothetical protein WB988_21275 [Candidatus Nitrosopolaris sp.]